MFGLTHLLANPTIIIGAALAIALSGLWGGWEARGVYEDAGKYHAVEQQARNAEAASIEIRGIAKETLQRMTALKIVNRTINNEVRHEIATQRVFLDPGCDLPDSTFQLLNRALAGPKGASGRGIENPTPGLAPSTP